MPAAIQGVKTAETRALGCARAIGGTRVMPRERHESPIGAQIETRPRIMYWRGESESWDMGIGRK